MNNFVSSDEAIEFVDYRVLKNEDMTAFREVMERHHYNLSENMRNTFKYTPQLTVFSLSGVNAYLLWSKGRLGKAIRRYFITKFREGISRQAIPFNETIESVDYRVLKNEAMTEFRGVVSR